MTQQIRITVPKSGESKVEAEGFTGTGCTDATKAIRDAMGKTVGDDPKPEMFVTETEQQSIGQ